MEDTDWRPSSCPACGTMREAARHPVCRNVDCSEDVAKRHLKTMINKEPKRYLWVHAPNPAIEKMEIVTDLEYLHSKTQFNQKTDKLYELGPEVKLEVSVKIIPAGPIYRKNRSGYRETFENRD